MSLLSTMWRAKNLTNPKGDMSCFSQSVSMTKRNNIVLLKNKVIFALTVQLYNTFFQNGNSILFNERVMMAITHEDFVR
jgi:hypothetical protein